MPRVSSFEILNKREQPVLTIQRTVSARELPQTIGQGYAKMEQYLTGQKQHLANPPYVAYYNMDEKALQVELGFPVAREYPGEGDIKYGVLPGGKVLSCIYRGPYEQMQPTYMEMMEYIKSKGLTGRGISLEYYLNGPEFPPEEMLTMIEMPIE